MRTKKELPSCPVETTLTSIDYEWKLLIFRDLTNGTKRFGELRKSVGNISQKVLTENSLDRKRQVIEEKSLCTSAA